jgi:hypothetical protein
MSLFTADSLPLCSDYQDDIKYLNHCAESNRWNNDLCVTQAKCLYFAITTQPNDIALTAPKA